MRGMVAGLVVALIIVLVALLVAALGAIGVAAIGWLVSRWFDLTQWQGSLIALAVGLSVGLGVYRMAAVGDSYAETEWVDWEEPDDEDGEGSEPPIVPWRRQRPTQGDLPSKGSKPSGSRRK